jgi:hypothetical protein
MTHEEKQEKEIQDVVTELCRQYNVTDKIEILNAKLFFIEGARWGTIKLNQQIRDKLQPKSEIIKVSNCCGAMAVSNGDTSTEDYGICPDCKEHCEYVNEDKE